MKILRTIESFFPYSSGPANQALQISKQLIRKGHESPIFTTFFNISKKSPEKELYQKVPVARFRDTFRFMKYIRTPGMQGALAERGCDLVHAHNYRSYQTELAFRAARKKKVPFVINTHGSLLGYTYFVKGLKSAPYMLYDLFHMKRYVKKADAVVVSSRFEIDEARRFGVPKKKIRLTPAGIDLDDYDPKRKDKPTIELLTVGRLSRSRNVEMMIRAMDFLDNKRFRLTIVGPEAKRSESSRQGYLRELKQMSRGKNIRFLGEKKGAALNRCYDQADIFIYTSLYENFGQTILQAAASRLPLISTRVGIALDLIEPGRTGYFVGFRDPRQIAASVKKLGSFRKRQEFGRRLYKMVEKDFTWQSIAESYIGLYEELLQKNL
jgi:glycosyltransferase involved in cell wall biosynthesis